MNEGYHTDLENIYETEWVQHVSTDATFEQRRESLLVDSGAACHVCPRSWLPEDAKERLGERLLRTASGERMRYYGQLRVMISIPGVPGRGESPST